MTALPTGTVTFLFTDVEGSTRLWEQHPEAMRTALARHDALLTEAIEQYGGLIVRSRGEGDSFFAVFTRATDALAAALSIQQRLHAEPWQADVGLRVRIAMHTGEAELREGDYYGSAVNRCARLRAAAHGGQVLLSLASQELVRDHLPPEASLCDLGEHRLKDLTRPERVFQLVHPDLPADFPHLRTLDVRPNNLPAQPNPLIGRETELESIRRLLLRRDVRLVTLTGAGGSGKTRLGLQAAADLLDDFVDGVFSVQLAPISDPGLVVVTIAQALGVREAEGRPLGESLKEHLQEKQLLLLLDNFEQILPAARQVAELLAAAPRLKVLVTSRAVLRLQGEHDFAVPPLALPDHRRPLILELLSQYAAVELFIQRALAARSDFAVTNENAPAIAEICHRLDGLPLAIELAAARIRSLPSQTLLARLERRLPLLTGGARDLPARQQTLRNTIAWSYDLLTEEEKLLYRRLAVFVGGCTLEAAEAICAVEGDLTIDVLEGLSSLVDQSLLKQEELPGGEPRYWLLETIREFGLECLAASGEKELIRRRHADFFVQFLERRGEWGSAGADRMEQEHDNLRAVHEWFVGHGEAEVGLRFLEPMALFWYARGYLNEGRARLLQVLALPEAQAPTAARARALHLAGLLAQMQGDGATAISFNEQSLAIYRELEHAWGIGIALRHLGILAGIQGDTRRARVLIEEALSIFKQHGYSCEVADTLTPFGNVLRREGDYDRAGAIYQECLETYRGLGGREWLIGLELRNLGHVANFHGDHWKAGELFRQSLELLVETGHNHIMPGCLAGMAGVASAEGQPERGARLLGAAQALVETMSAVWDPVERTEYDRHLAAVKVQLVETAFTAEWAAGHALSLDQAIAEALGETTHG
jgi:predicted ATPase/class 3 adenylate cyclase